MNTSVVLTGYGIPIRNLWHMLVYAWSDHSISQQIAFGDVEEAPTLDALLASMLAKLAGQRLRIGLGRGYVELKAPIRAIRGRVNFTESLNRNSFEQGQAFCEFQSYDLNIPKNQIIRSTLAHLCQTGNFGADRLHADALRRTMRGLVRALDGIELIGLQHDLICRHQFGEKDNDYRLMLGICELVLLTRMPADSTGETRLPGLDRSELTLHIIYERFVAGFYRIHLKGWHVSPQKHLSWHEGSPNPLLPMMRPDLVLEEKSTGRVLVLDTKFTPKSLIENQWGKKEFDSSHLYQLYAYVKTQEHVSPGHHQASGILLYPSLDGSVLSEQIQLQDISLRVENIDLTRPWQEVEEQLLQIVHET
jgi:5-methylcytosine-specific restriction enzyme subunit McrC